MRFGCCNGGESIGDRQQAIDFFFHHRVALAAVVFKTLPINHRDLTTPVADQSGFLQTVSYEF
jgi:hypothetical protein